MSKQRKQKSGFKQTLIEWGGIVAIVAVLYVTGLHTEVLGTVQRVMLWSGLFDAEAKKIATTDGPHLSNNAYSMSLKTRQNSLVELADFKGRVVFVNLWASWCPPCVAEMPTIESLYNAVSDNEKIKFLLISIDEKHEDATDFMENKEYSMPYYFPVSGIPQVFQSSYIPSTYVISKDGQIVYKQEGIADYSSEAFREWLLGLSQD